MKFLFALIPLSVLGCDSTQLRCDEAADFSPSAVIGTGTNRFEPINEADVLPAIWGPQGGHHVWGSVKVTGVNPGDGKMVNPNPDIDGGRPVYEPRGEDVVTVTFSMAFHEDRIESYDVAFLGFLSGTAEEAEFLGQTVFVDLNLIDTHYPEVEALPVEMGVTVEDACGTVVSSSQSFYLSTSREDEEW